MKSIGIYVHIPFCKQKCKYCDFKSYSGIESKINSYIKCVCEEIKEVGNQIKQDKEDVIVSTIYIGGGTPSYIEAKNIVNIINTIKNNFVVDDLAEVTIEVNPGAVDLNKFVLYKEVGINRISIGVQSANNVLLKQLGRIHLFEDAISCFNMAREAGFDNINMDFIIGVPNQTLKDIDEIVKEVILLKPEHVSIYSLIVEEGTVMQKQIEQQELFLPGDDVERQMYWKVKCDLEKNGYEHYEISNFAKKGCYSKHNTNCWAQKEYMGFGVSAHSYMNMVRFSNIDNIDEYIKNVENDLFEANFVFHEKQDKVSQMKEYMILGLRKLKGVSYNDFFNKFNVDMFEIFDTSIQKLLRMELIDIDNGLIRLSKKGLDFANIVWEEFI